VIDVDKPGLASTMGRAAVAAVGNPDPELRSVRPGRAAGGSDWIGLRRNEGHTVAGINQLPLLPEILVALAFLMAIGGAWWREGGEGARPSSTYR
jgi:hypothetical protein